MIDYKDLPQLIVALDSKSDDANYIHIRDAKDDKKYYCPCCYSIVKPRAYKEEKEYQVQPHFYHVNGECSAESRVHWLYKNWLFKPGCKFYINDKLYTVKETVIEKTYHTKFGDYRPDITVILDNDEVMFFEINFSSSKKEDNYFCKWNELNKDVVEVDIRKLINIDYKSEIPTFELIYSDGVCYKKQYQKRDLYANTIGVMKQEWKRQDKINYKIQWEKLDWFWIELQKYKNKKCSKEDILNKFKDIDISNKEFCFDLIKKMNCIKDIKQELRDIINDEIIIFFTKDNLNKIISSNIFELNNVSCEPKSGIYVNYILKNGRYFERFHKSICSREWFIRYSNIIEMIDLIKRSVHNFENIKDNKILFKKYFNSIFDEINKKYFSNENCIWKIEHNDLQEDSFFNYKYYFTVKIGLKNSNKYNEYFNISHSFEEDLLIEKINKDLLSKTERYLRVVRDRLMKYDGINNDRRRMIINNY